jgi:hypothetical protein
MTTQILNQAKLKELLDYSPDTGGFTWRVNRARTAKANAPAGTKNNVGYIRIIVCGKQYSAHRLAWLYVHGEWPVGEIDHINRDKADNRLANLRQVTRSENCQNKDPAKLPGITWHKATSKWQARIKINQKLIHLGVFADIVDAKNARKQAELTYHTHRPN